MTLFPLPAEAAPLLLALAPAFTAPTAQRFHFLLVAAILTTGRRTVANLLRTLGDLVRGHRTSYQRFLSAASWSGLQLGCLLCGFVLRHLVPDGHVTLVGDDTVESHPGRKVYGKARHRDPVRSSHAYTAWRYGHKWIVLAVLVPFPFASRPWALPVLIDLYRFVGKLDEVRRLAVADGALFDVKPVPYGSGSRGIAVDLDQPGDEGGVRNQAGGRHAVP